MSQGQLVKGHCWHRNWADTVKRGFRFLNFCFETVEDFAEEQWKRGSGAGGFVATNASLAALIIVIDEILSHLVATGELRRSGRTDDELRDAVRPYLAYIGHFVASLDHAAISRMRSFGGGGAKIRIAREYQNAINDEDDGFNPEGFQQWKKESTLVFNAKVKPLCEKLNGALRDYVRKRMKEVHGEKKWIESLPTEVATKTFERRALEGYKESQENYIDLADYEKIIDKNSGEVFDIAVFTTPGFKGGSNKKKLSWFAPLIRVRNKTAHPERDPVTEEEYETIRILHDWLAPRLGSSDVSQKSGLTQG